MNRRPMPEVNMGSMADIAFLLLIFFLVATTMDIDTGMIRKLPPKVDQPPPEIHDRNVLVVLVNADDQLMIEGELTPINEIRDKTREFLLNPEENPDLSEHVVKKIDPFGDVMVTKGLISLQNHRGTSYKMYVTVMNELIAAGNALKDEFSKQHVGKAYDDLPAHLQDAVKDAMPTMISEADPFDNAVSQNR